MIIRKDNQFNVQSRLDKEEFIKDIFNTAVKRYDLMNTLMTLGLD